MTLAPAAIIVRTITRPCPECSGEFTVTSNGVGAYTGETVSTSTSWSNGESVLVETWHDGAVQVVAVQCGATHADDTACTGLIETTRADWNEQSWEAAPFGWSAHAITPTRCA